MNDNTKLKGRLIWNVTLRTYDYFVDDYDDYFIGAFANYEDAFEKAKEVLKEECKCNDDKVNINHNENNTELWYDEGLNELPAVYVDSIKIQ